MDMREKLARTIDPERWIGFDDYAAAKGWTEAEKAEELAERIERGDGRLARSLDRADAVLDAMRSPDEAMIEAGVEGVWPGTEIVYPDEHDGPEEAVIAGWTAMIDAARTPAKES